MVEVKGHLVSAEVKWSKNLVNTVFQEHLTVGNLMLSMWIAYIKEMIQRGPKVKTLLTLYCKKNITPRDLILGLWIVHI